MHTHPLICRSCIAIHMTFWKQWRSILNMLPPPQKSAIVSTAKEGTHQMHESHTSCIWCMNLTHHAFVSYYTQHASELYSSQHAIQSKCRTGDRTRCFWHVPETRCNLVPEANSSRFVNPQRQYFTQMAQQESDRNTSVKYRRQNANCSQDKCQVPEAQSCSSSQAQCKFVFNAISTKFALCFSIRHSVFNAIRTMLQTLSLHWNSLSSFALNFRQRADLWTRKTGKSRFDR